MAVGQKYSWGGCDHNVYWLSPLLPIPEVGELLETLIFFLEVFIIMLMFPISREELRMKCKNLFYPPGLYKVIKLAHLGDEYGDVLPTMPLQRGKAYFFSRQDFSDDKSWIVFFSFHPRLSRGWYGPLEGITSSSTVELKTSQYIIEHKRMFLGVKVE